MKKIYRFFVYILASDTGTIYIGVTNNLIRRITEHKNCINKESFTKKYNCNKLVYFEEYDYISSAVKREKQLKKWSREKKEKLVKMQNPYWEDLYQRISFFL